MNNLIGLVLCGGKSIRMGTDKGQIFRDEKTWAQHAADKLFETGLTSFISINGTQEGSYRMQFSQDQLVIDHSEFPGPLRGILSAHDQFPESDLLVLACDMIDMEAATIRALMAAYQQSPGFDFYAWKNGEFWEPFCGIYTAEGLRHYSTWQKNGKIQNFSMQEMLEKGKTCVLPLEWKRSFGNYNSEKELRKT